MVLVDDFYHNLVSPSLPWKITSHQIIFLTASLSRIFLYGFNKTEVNGLPRFLDLLRARADPRDRSRGLITVSNHISVLDDPLIWGTLPFNFSFYHTYQNHRWTLGSHDLCFSNTILSHFFTLGQLFPTHRIKHSPSGGLFQPVMTEAIRMLGHIDTQRASWSPYCRTQPLPLSSWPRDAIDAFSPVHPAPSYPSCPNDVRSYLAPSRYASNSYGWVHIFPEGFVHQTDPSERYMRYFKWGISRLILEPEICPDIVPMFVEGTDQIMHEARTWPRFLPRIGKKVAVTFGPEIDVDAVFGDLRRKWRSMVEAEYERERKEKKDVFVQGKKRSTPTDVDGDPGWDELRVGIVPERLKWDPEAVELRKKCTRRVRDEVLKVRRSRGYPDEDPKAGVADTWQLEGSKREGKMEDESWVKEA